MSTPKVTWTAFLSIESLFLLVSILEGSMHEILHSLFVMGILWCSRGWLRRMEIAELFNEELSWRNHESLCKTHEGQEKDGVNPSSS